MFGRFIAAFVPISMVMGSGIVAASPMVYTPVNPTFGGSPANGANLLATAQAQNSTHAPTKTPIQKFNDTLQQAILNKLSSEAVTTIFGSSSVLQPGHYDTGTYTVDIVPGTDGSLTVTTTDKSSGATANYLISNPGQL